MSNLDFIPIEEEITTQYDKGSQIDVPLHDGALLSLQKLDDSYDPLDKGKAILRLHEAEKEGKVLTGLLYVNPDAKDHTEILNIADTPLNQLSEKELCPGSNSLASINSSLN